MAVYFKVPHNLSPGETDYKSPDLQDCQKTIWSLSTCTSI